MHGWKGHATIFWDAEGILLIDYLSQGKIIIGDYYVGSLLEIHQAAISKGHRKLIKEVKLLHVSPPSHTSTFDMATSC